ncbi:MAG TPA: LamG domain-containing protein, partial [Sedimentisphaerales bacterium]|nr:LamG domain-containing protein [Sedimentisphaerales bacterium]
EARTYEAFTVALWVRADRLGQGQYMSPFSSYTPTGPGFQIDVDGTNPGNYQTTPGIGIHGPVTLEWVHLAVVCEGTTIHYYYNGTWVTSGTIAPNNLLFNEFIIGTSRNRGNNFYGAIDDFRFYDLALTQDEMAWLGGRTTPFDKPF